ncbi:MAG: peptidoglycan D,D-transpeptidase FtsI family protein [Acidobacteriaceae bacterium]
MKRVLNAKSKATKNSSNTRIFLLLAVVFVFIGLISLRLFYLQVANSSHYVALADGQHGSERTILPKRGEIFLSSQTGTENVLVATNITKNLVFAVPKDIKDKSNTAAKLARLLELPEQDILDKLNGSNKNYVVIKKQLSEDLSKAITDQKLPGIALEPETIRFYPENNLASQVLGFLGFKNNQRVGQYGIEGEFEDRLAGSPGTLDLEKDLAGRWITFAARDLNPARDGDSIVLTIDPGIQFKAQQVLADAVKAHSAASGSVVVVDPKTGRILAMANYPDFDPNNYGKVENVSYYSNPTVSNDYEPGSVFKPLTMAAAINEGKVTPETTYEDVGFVQLDDYKIQNSDKLAHGIQTMTQVLDLSLNTGAVFAEQQLGQDLFKSYVQKFGFGQPTGVDLPGETKGNIDNLNRKGDVFFGTASYGQGITATAIQLIKAYTAIANGGKMVEPHVVDKIIHPDQSEETVQTKTLDQVLTSRTAATVSAMLVDVVENGHGKRAGVKGYYIAGKTGTAQVPYTDRAGYDPDKNIGTFIGFGPVDDPQFLALVRIDSPKGVKFAESTAAPAFGDLASFILNYLQVPPKRQ